MPPNWRRNIGCGVTCVMPVVQIIKAISENLGPGIWSNAVVGLTHASETVNGYAWGEFLAFGSRDLEPRDCGSQEHLAGFAAVHNIKQESRDAKRSFPLSFLNTSCLYSQQGSHHRGRHACNGFCNLSEYAMLPQRNLQLGGQRRFSRSSESTAGTAQQSSRSPSLRTPAAARKMTTAKKFCRMVVHGCRTSWKRCVAV